MKERNKNKWNTIKWKRRIRKEGKCVKINGNGLNQIAKIQQVWENRMTEDRTVMIVRQLKERNKNEGKHKHGNGV